MKTRKNSSPEAKKTNYEAKKKSSEMDKASLGANTCSQAQKYFETTWEGYAAKMAISGKKMNSCVMS